MRPVYIAMIVAAVAVIAGAYLFLVGFAPSVVSAGDTVSVFYTGSFTNGTIFDSNVGGQPLNFTVGANQVITGFNNAVIGMKLNQTKTITLPENEAYGPVNPAMVVVVPLSVFGNKTAQVGMVVTQTNNGQQYQGRITSVNSTNATIDFNSPLAGKTLVFTVRVVKITH